MDNDAENTVHYDILYSTCNTIAKQWMCPVYCVNTAWPAEMCACEIAGTKPTAGVRARLNPSALPARVCEIHPGNWT